jgi:hypothetical protein
VADRAGRQPVHMDGDGSGLVIHAVEALAGDQNVSPGPYSLGRLANSERLVPGAAFDHVDADTRASVVALGGIARLPPQIEPRFRMLITPPKHRLTRAGAVEPAWLDQRHRHEQPPPLQHCAEARPRAGGG